MSGELVKLLSDLKEPEALEFVEKALAQGTDPMDLLKQIAILPIHLTWPLPPISFGS